MTSYDKKERRQSWKQGKSYKTQTAREQRHKSKVQTTKDAQSIAHDELVTPSSGCVFNDLGCDCPVINCPVCTCSLAGMGGTIENGKYVVQRKKTPERIEAELAKKKRKGEQRKNAKALRHFSFLRWAAEHWGGRWFKLDKYKK